MESSAGSEARIADLERQVGRQALRTTAVLTAGATMPAPWTDAG